VQAEVRLYDRLFKVEDPTKPAEGREAAATMQEEAERNLNPDSLEALNEAWVEPALAELEPGAVCQFERLGYFCADAADWQADAPVFNRTVGLRDTWARMQKK